MDLELVMQPWPFILAVLATFAGSYIISTAEVSTPVRNGVQSLGWRWTTDDPRFLEGKWTELPRRGFFRWLWNLLECPYCTGWYCAIGAAAVAADRPDLLSLAWWLTVVAVYGAHCLVVAVFSKL